MARHAIFQLALGFLLIFSFAVAYGKGIQPMKKLTIYDADGKRIASVMDEGIDGNPAIALKVNGVILILYVTRFGFIGRGVNLLFESADCSGTPYIGVQYPDSLVPDNVVWDNRVFVLDPDHQPRIVYVQSVYWVGAGCQDTSSQAFEAELVQARMQVDLNQIYKPPFVLK